MANVLRIKRRTSGLPGAPAALENAELAFNEVDSTLYYGEGTAGVGGSATSVIAIAGRGAFVSLSGTSQTITGAKVFSGSVDLGSSAIAATPTAGDNSTKVATTAFVATAIAEFTADIDIAGDSGTGTVDFNTQSLIVSGGTGLTSVASNQTITVNLDNTTVTAGSYGSSTQIPTFTVDAQGRLTAAGTSSVATTLGVAGDTGTGTVNLLTQSLTVSGGTGLSSTSSNQTVTVNLDNTTVTAGAYGSASSVAEFTVDAQGRLTSAGSTTISITHSNVSDFDTAVRANRLDQLAAPTATVSLNGQTISNLGTPLNSTDAANKAYVDNAISGLAWKDSVHTLATTNVALTGLTGTLVIDSHPAFTTAEDSYRVLLIGQTTTSENGIYVYTDNGVSYTLTRASDADTYQELVGAAVFVLEGTLYANTAWVQSDHYITSFSGQDWVQFAGGGAYTAGAGLTQTGTVFDVGTASTSRIVVNANDIDLATTGIVAGDYTKLTIDAYGRATAGSNPTTLSGYGITDAQPLDATLTALAGVTVAADQLIYATGADAFSTTAFSSFGRSLVDDADASAARTTLGLGTIATQNSNNVSITGGTIDNITFDGGTF